MILNPNKLDIINIGEFVGDLLDYVGVIAFIAWLVSIWIVFG